MGIFILHNLPLVVTAAILVYVAYEYWRYRRYQHRAQVVEPVTVLSMPDKLVLVRRINQLTMRQVRIMYVMAFLFLLAMLILFYMVAAAKHPDRSVVELLILMWNGLIRQPKLLFDTLMVTAVLIGIPKINHAINQREHLILDRSGIFYQSPLRGRLSVLSPSWQMSWSEIDSVVLNNYLVRGRLIIKPIRGQQQVLIVPAWSRPEDIVALSQLPLFVRLHELRRQQQRDLQTLLATPLLRYFTDVARIKIDISEHIERDFDLGSHPITRLLVVVLFSLISYGLVDVILDTETYVTVPPILVFVLSGLVLAVGLGMWQLRHRVPTVNAWGLASLLGVVFALALYPGLLRLNQLTDSAGLQQIEYRHIMDNRFSPVRADLPEIIMPADAYWQSIPENHIVVFSLRRGKLDFYQIDMAPEYAKMRRWYCRHRAGQDQVKLRYCDKL